MNKTELTLIDGGDRIVRQATHWFVRLRADDTSEAERGQWRRWLEEDPAHRLAYERMERFWSSLGDFANAADVERRLRGRTGAPGGRRWRKRRGRRARDRRPFPAAPRSGRATGRRGHP